jgi:NAD(P) transhydrogenase subunit beta
VKFESIIPYFYIAASVLFIIGLKQLSRADTARKGNMISSLGMLLAIVATLLYSGMSFEWIAVGSIGGAVIGGVVARRVRMTAMPEMVGLFNGFGGLASLLVGWAEYHLIHAVPASARLFTLVAIGATVLIGGVTFSGSMIAFAKLGGKMDGRPVLFSGQKILNAALLVLAIAASAWVCVQPGWSYGIFIGLAAASLILGVLVTIPIGGADMPVVISLLNSYSGLAACGAGFVIMNNVLIVAGALVGASGLILTSIMCRAMNRSLANVMFGGVGAGSGEAVFRGEARTVSPEDAYLMLEAASSVVFVPGYGMAVAQAQHAVRELGDLLEANGCEVRYCVHPVAGRMPGHMNVLLAEAQVPYEQLVEPQDVNPTIASVDVAVVIGANDVVNPAAREKGTPLYGMPIINVDQARVCIVLKRSLKAGFAGVDNPLFFAPNARMLLGDAKESINALVTEFKD